MYAHRRAYKSIFRTVSLPIFLILSKYQCYGIGNLQDSFLRLLPILSKFLCYGIDMYSKFSNPVIYSITRFFLIFCIITTRISKLRFSELRQVNFLSRSLW